MAETKTRKRRARDPRPWARELKGAKPSLDAKLPSYQTAADYMEQKNGAGIRLVGWSLGRAALIAVPVRVAGATWKQAIWGGLLASALISSFVLLRLNASEVK